RRAGVIPRRRLLDLLHRSLERRLILVAAPAGYGKTTLLVEFAHELGEQDVPVCWLTLGPADADARTFFEHLTLSVRGQFPGFGKQTNLLLRSLDNAEREATTIAATFC